MLYRKMEKAFRSHFSNHAFSFHTKKSEQFRLLRSFYLFFLKDHLQRWFMNQRHLKRFFKKRDIFRERTLVLGRVISDAILSELVKCELSEAFVTHDKNDAPPLPHKLRCRKWCHKRRKKQDPVRQARVFNFLLNVSTLNGRTFRDVMHGNVRFRTPTEF